jgi:hypothetical protein
MQRRQSKGSRDVDQASTAGRASKGDYQLPIQTAVAVGCCPGLKGLLRWSWNPVSEQQQVL